MKHKKMQNLRVALIEPLVLMTILGCSSRSKFTAGDYIMPEGQPDPANILKIVGVGEENYKTFTHFLSNGRLVQAQDYQDRKRTDIDKDFVKIQPPEVGGSFSPDKYLSKQEEAPLGTKTK